MNSIFEMQQRLPSSSDRARRLGAWIAPRWFGSSGPVARRERDPSRDLPASAAHRLVDSPKAANASPAASAASRSSPAQRNNGRGTPGETRGARGLASAADDGPKGVLRERESRARQRLLVHARARVNRLNVTTRQPIQRNYAPAATKQAQRRRSVPTEPAGRKCCRTSGAAGASNPHAAVQTGGRPLCRCLCPKRQRLPRSIRKTVDHEGWFGPFARQPDNVGQARSVSTKLVSETVVREP
jgi:hypothetical protein